MSRIGNVSSDCPRHPHLVLVGDSGMEKVSGCMARRDRNSRTSWDLTDFLLRDVLAQERGRLELPCAAEDWFRDALEPMNIILLPLNAAVACTAVNLSPVHKDPFDRLIIATALVYDGRLASVDGLFPLYPELRDRLFV
jgi:hypothetical protein